MRISSKIPTRPWDWIKGNMCRDCAARAHLAELRLGHETELMPREAGVNDKMCGAGALARENFQDTGISAAKIGYEEAKSLASKAKCG